MADQTQAIAKRTRTVFQRIGAVFLGFYLVITFTPIVKWMVMAMDGEWYSGNGEVLVVLSGAMLRGGENSTPVMGWDTYVRTVYAAWVLHQQSFHTVVVTGAGGAASAMARYLEQQGVPPESILQEGRATSTYQNALYTRELLLEHYRTTIPPPVVVLTSDFHSWRARHVFEKAGFRTHMIAIPDALKLSYNPRERWNVFITLVTEWVKDAGYLVLGRL